MPTYLNDYEMDIMLALSAGNLPDEMPRNYKEALKMDVELEEAIKEEIKKLEELFQKV